MAEQPLVGIIMGSKSDLPTMEGCTKQLDEFGIPYELVIASAHRNPAKVHEWASTAADRGLRVIIAAAGKAAHLGGVVAAYTPLPIIGVPMKTSDLGGMDSLLSMVQMPSGVPVACVAINGAKNAAIYAAQILGAGDPNWREKVAEFKRRRRPAPFPFRRGRVLLARRAGWSVPCRLCPRVPRPRGQAHMGPTQVLAGWSRPRRLPT